MMNLLLTCSGRRNYLVDYFKEALGGKGEVIAVNSIMDVTSMVVADKAIVAPPLTNEDYIGFLLETCAENNIKLLVSLFDLELPLLAKNKALFEDAGVKVAVSDSQVISICNDKIRTAEFGDNLKLRTLYTTTDVGKAAEKDKFPYYIKPRWGMGSIAIQKADNPEELALLHKIVQRDIRNSYIHHYESSIPEEAVIIQEAATGEEYGLDVVNDFEGNYVATFVKRKLAMRSGETDGAITEHVPVLQQLGKKISSELGHVGNLDVDVFWNGTYPVILEMNARFGGGYPFSHISGADIPRAYLQWAKGEKAGSENFTIKYGVKGLKGITMLRV